MNFDPHDAANQKLRIRKKERRKPKCAMCDSYAEHLKCDWLGEKQWVFNVNCNTRGTWHLSKHYIFTPEIRNCCSYMKKGFRCFVFELQQHRILTLPNRHEQHEKSKFEFLFHLICSYGSVGSVFAWDNE